MRRCARLLAVLVGCGTPPRADGQPGAAAQPGAQSQRPAGPKRMVVALKDDVPGLSEKVRIGPGGGIWIAEEIVNAGLAIYDGNGVLQPLNAERVPSLENGLWKVNTDGTMETTWRIRPGVAWHDGTPFTSADLVFTAALERDPLVPFAGRNIGWGAVERIDAPDPQTIVVGWTQPYVDADLLFSRRFGMPAARHRLEQAYGENNTCHRFRSLPVSLSFWERRSESCTGGRVREAGYSINSSTRARNAGGRVKPRYRTVRWFTTRS